MPISLRLGYRNGLQPPTGRPGAGFTLLELGVVVMLLGVIAAIAMTSLWAAKQQANETSAIQSLRTIATQCELYKLKNDIYPPSLAAMAAVGYLETPLGTGHRSGYDFGSQGGGGDGILGGTIHTWSCYAEPTVPGQTGNRCFRVDETGVIQESEDNGATWHTLR